mmetsp:Transcript_33925/g.109582  ORF Transcript_33925/g.109582 Transcript_33925/m.109582 type:complete len:313 (-) Transcript_33925:1249-2187(-)
MKCRHRLRERGWVDALGHNVAGRPAAAQRCCQLDVCGGRPVEGGHGGGHADGDPGHARDEPQAGGGLGGEAGDAADAAEGRGGSRDIGRLREAERDEAEAADEAGDGVPIVLVKLGRVSGALEHVKHLLSDKEASRDVHSRDCGGCEPQRLGECGGCQPAAHGVHSAHGSHARHGVGHGHQRGVERVRHAPHNLVPDDARQRKGGEHVGESCRGRDDAHAQNSCRAVPNLLGRGHVHLFIVLVSEHNFRLGGGLGLGRRRRGRRPGPLELALVEHSHAAHGNVVWVQREDALLLCGDGACREDPLALVVGVQ